MSDILGTGLAFPLQVDRRGDIALVGGENDVTQAIMMILATSPGERPMRPEFGCDIHEFAFDSIDPSLIGRVDAEVRRALGRWEPRIEVLELNFDLSMAGQGALIINVGYRILATNQRRNLVYPFYVIPPEEGV
jgi:phage baseplate assembly protein W